MSILNKVMMEKNYPAQFKSLKKVFMAMLCVSALSFSTLIQAQTCTANAGTLIADDSTVPLVGGVATLTATQGNAPIVPTDFEVVYVLTSGTGLVIQQSDAAPSFDVTAGGLYTLHTFVAELTDDTSPDYFDPTLIVPGTTTAGQVNTIISATGICADLDTAGAPVFVCSADSGTLTADATPVGIESGGVTISATENAPPSGPVSYELRYVLTSGDNLIIEALSETPSFTVLDTGLYTIHSFVAELTDDTDPNYIDISIITPGTTPASTVIDLIDTNDICASLDAVGAPIEVVCDASAGTLTADATPVGIESGGVTISASEDTAPNVPNGYSLRYVLTSGAGLIIEEISENPSFTVPDTGLYTIHG